jgi:hypothetical protein
MKKNKPLIIGAAVIGLGFLAYHIYKRGKKTTDATLLSANNNIKISIRDFNFEFAGYGHYKVIYTSPKSGKSWIKTITNMQIIDATKNADEPTQKDLNQLKYFVKN